jgi:NAD(P)-dependent dehydrogenase (short-subunit alcohol dehydrogenase family)
MRLQGSVALVTGGARRVGRILALGLAKRGCHVAITYRTSQKEAQKTCKEIEANGVRGVAIPVDQRDSRQVAYAVAEVRDRLGGLDILINNASSFYPTPWESVSAEEWMDLLATNLSGPWYFAQAAGRWMKRQGHGKIVNMVDVAVFSPWPNYLPYCVAKGGLVTLTRGLAKALAPQVQVNAVAPGPILFPPNLSERSKNQAIERTLLKRKGDPKDLLQAVLFFLEGSDFVTGVILPVDGGRLLT